MTNRLPSIRDFVYVYTDVPLFSSSEFVRTQNVPRGGRRNILQSDAPGTLGEGVEAYFGADRDVRRREGRRCRRNRFHRLLSSVQTVHAEADEKTAERSAHPLRFTLH